MAGFARVMLVGSASALVMGFATASVAADDNGTTEIDGVTVNGVKAGLAVSTKADVPVLENPQAVSVITSETLKAQGITRLADALRNVAGVTRSSTYGYYDSYQIRGYDAAYGSIFLDGLTSGNVAGAVNELAGLEQVEVVKGPASALFGASPLGGIVNLVSKRPKADPSLELGLATGSYGLAEVTVDATGPVSPGGNLLGRLNFVYRDGDNFVKSSHAQRIYLAPALTWKIGEDTSLTLLGRYQRDYDSPWSPVPAWGTILPLASGDLPIDFAIDNGGAQKVVNNINAKQIGYVFDHRFGETLSFSQTVRYEERRTYWDRWMFVAGFLDDNVVGGVQQGHVIGRYLYGPFLQTDKDLAADSRVTWKFETGAIGHNLLAGVDYRSTRETHASGPGDFDPADNPLDLLNPDYSTPLVRTPGDISVGSGKSSQVGFYLHDHLTLTDRLTLTIGGRWDTAKSGDQKDNAFSPHAGLTWMLRPGASAYVNYSKSFTPTSSWQTRFDGGLLPPETGENIEAGLKVQTPDGALSGMVSIYQLTRQNVATEDPAHPFFYVVTGEQRSRGLEVEGAWRPNAAIEVTGAYARIDAKVTKDNTLPVGMPLANFPENSLSLWGRYRLQGGPLARLAISLGLVYNSEKYVYESRLYTLPAYTVLDAGLSYPFGPWDAQLNISNLTDERYFPDACCLDRITPGAPRSWRLSLRRTF